MARVFALILAFSIAAAAQAQSTGSHRINSPVQSLHEVETSTVTHAKTVIFDVNNGQWNTSQSYDPCVPDPTADPLLLLFSGMAAPPALGPQNIGRATASRAAFLSNPLTAWVQDSSNPVLVTGSAGQPDSKYIRQSSCLYNPDDGGKLYEYYTCDNGSVDQMCLAWSADQGHTWTKYGVVMSPSIDGCADETWVSQGAVMRRDPGDWIMVYSWRNPDKGVILPGTRYVTSKDGKKWVGRGTCSNSLTAAPIYLEQHQIMMLGGKCLLFYENGNLTVPWTIGLASAPTCEGPFTVSPRSPILKPSASGWDSTFVATPWFMTVAGRSYLWYSATNESKANYNFAHWPLSLGRFVKPF
jgi:hypothetical protein